MTTFAPLCYYDNPLTFSHVQVVAVCLEVQEAESATVITFSPYHQGCVPLLLINHFPDVSLRFAQGIK